MSTENTSEDNVKAEPSQGKEAEPSQGQQAEPSQGQEVAAIAERYSRSRSRRHSTSRHRTYADRSDHSHRPALTRRLSKWEKRGLGALLLLPWLFVLALVVWRVMGAAQSRDENARLLTRLQDVQQTNRKLTDEENKLKADLAQMVTGRMPGELHPIRFDHVIDIDKNLLKNVLFTEIRQGQQNGYQYRLLLANKQQNRVQPKVTILVFDNLGIQIGSADISGSPDYQTISQNGLGPGESQSFSGNITLTLDRKPCYFMLMESATVLPGA